MGDQLRVVIPVRLREETALRIEQLARLWGRSVSYTLRAIVEDWLREREKRAQKAP